jgi:hypothetical protein
MKPHRLAVFGLAAGLLGGGAVGLALTGATLAGAQVSDVTGTVTDPAATTDTTVPDIGGIVGDLGSTTTTEAPTTTTTSEPSTTEAPAASDPSTTTTPATPAPATPDPSTGSQAKGDCDRGGPGGPGRPGHGGRDLDAAAQALGMTADELRTALQGGKSLADVAKEKGVDVSKVVDALVAQLKAHLDQEVAEGEHTPAEADQMLADARTHIEAFVNGTAPAGGFGFGGRHGGRTPGHFD